MKEMIYEVGSFVFLGIIIVALLGALHHFYPHLIETISQYLRGRTPRYWFFFAIEGRWRSWKN